MFENNIKTKPFSQNAYNLITLFSPINIYSHIHRCVILHIGKAQGHSIMGYKGSAFRQLNDDACGLSFDGQCSVLSCALSFSHARSSTIKLQLTEQKCTCGQVTSFTWPRRHGIQMSTDARSKQPSRILGNKTRTESVRTLCTGWQF